MVFCRGCAKEIHVSALTCPQCGATQAMPQVNPATIIYTSYDQVPWFRKRWCIVLFALFFSPPLFYVFLTGDAYYLEKGEVKIYPKKNKYLLMAIAALLTIRFIYSLTE